MKIFLKICHFCIVSPLRICTLKWCIFNNYYFSDSRLVTRQSRSQTDRSDFIPMSMPVHHPALYHSKDIILESKRELPDENENTEVKASDTARDPRTITGWSRTERFLGPDPAPEKLKKTSFHDGNEFLFRKILILSMNLKMTFLNLKKRNLKVVQGKRHRRKGFR